MQNQTTPGPWRVSPSGGGQYIWTADDTVVASVNGVFRAPASEHSLGYLQGETEANARLIAAAPELRDALRDTAAMLDAVWPTLADPRLSRRAAEQFEKARALLARLR